MAYKAYADPTRYEPRVEIVHATFAAIVMVALAVRVGRMRAGLQRQRAELAQALERIQMLATRDELTGLTNRRAAMERMHAELAVRHRPEPGMALTLIDLDHFKNTNDTLGHATGDAVLRRFAECATSVVRAGDFLARWGGEEFLLVMPATTPEEGLDVLARLRERLVHESSNADTSAPKVTFSAGVTRCADLQDLGQAIARADEAMYCARRSGRDRALLVPAPALTPAPEIRQPA